MATSASAPLCRRNSGEENGHRSHEENAEADGERSETIRAAEAELRQQAAKLLAMQREQAESKHQLQREKAETKSLRSQIESLNDQISELRAWQGSPASFEGAVAAAIQIAKQADTSQATEIVRLREEINDLRGVSNDAAASSASALAAAEARVEGPKAARDRLTAENKSLELALRGSQAELERTKKDLFAERVRSKRSMRELEASRAQVRQRQLGGSARELIPSAPLWHVHERSLSLPLTHRLRLLCPPSLATVPHWRLHS